jgi:hypothetical protein
MTTPTRAAGRSPSVGWPDTTGQTQPPKNHLYASAVWLLGRHPGLGRLALRVPGVVTFDADGPFIDLDLLASAFNGVEEYSRTWRAYEYSNPAPDADEDSAGYQAWCDAGPQPSTATVGLLPMSRSEKSRLRLLAAFACSEQVPFPVGDLYGFDNAGRRLLADWCLAVFSA